MLKPIRDNKRLSAGAFEAIRGYIVANKLQPGDCLPTEAEIAEKLNCGKSSVREALKVLEAMGVVKTVHGKRAIISMFSFSSIFDNLPQNIFMDKKKIVELLEVRKAIELFFIDKVLKNITSTQIAQLERIVTRMKREILDLSEFTKADKEFHVYLLSFARNKTARDFVQVYWNFQREHIEPLDKRSKEKATQDHMDILTAVKHKNLEKAKLALKRHFDDIESRLR